MSNSFPISSEVVDFPSQKPADTVRVGEVLGRGRHGVVMSATAPKVREEQVVTYALKIPSAEQTLDHEAAALTQLAHDNVIKLIDGPSRAGALLLERCDHGTLEDRVLSAGEAVSVLDQLATVLSHIHGLGWIHGDISPGNVGIRGDGTIALLDFATARHADGAEVFEGTDDFAGAIRTAIPALDVRCAAATVASRLNHGDELAGPLSALIARCDEDQDVEAASLAQLGEGHDASPLTGLGQNQSVEATTTAPTTDPTTKKGGGSGSGTREFGPRPGGEPVEDEDVPAKRNPLPSLLALLVVALVAAGLVLEYPTGASAEDSVELTTMYSAEETLERHGVLWQDGVVVRVGDKSTARFAVGEPGDIAAVGDWDCNGTNTLGIYRPSTGSWFTFESWDAKSISSTSNLGSASQLSIEIDGSCDHPRTS